MMSYGINRSLMHTWAMSVLRTGRWYSTTKKDKVSILDLIFLTCINNDMKIWSSSNLGDHFLSPGLAKEISDKKICSWSHD